MQQKRALESSDQSLLRHNINDSTRNAQKRGMETEESMQENSK